MKQKLQAQKKLVVEEALATLTTNQATTTLYVRSPTLRKQAPAYAVKLLKKCLIKKHLRKQQLNCYTHINKHSTTWHKRYWSDVRIDKCHGRDNDVSRDEKIPN